MGNDGIWILEDINKCVNTAEYDDIVVIWYFFNPYILEIDD